MSNNLTVPDFHAGIEGEQDRYFIEALSGTNGTCINEEKITR